MAERNDASAFTAQLLANEAGQEYLAVALGRMYTQRPECWSWLVDQVSDVLATIATEIAEPNG